MRSISTALVATLARRGAVRAMGPTVPAIRNEVPYETLAQTDTRSENVFEKWFAGSTGDPPVLPGNLFANTLLAAFSQQVNLSEPEFQKPDPDTNKPVTLDERQQLDTTVGARENFSALDETGDGQINLTESLKQVTKRSKLYQFFAGADTVNNGYVSWDKELFRQPGCQLFSIRF